MPQTIEHRIRVLDRPATPPYTTPPYSSPSSTVDRRRDDDQSWVGEERMGAEGPRNQQHKRTKSYEGGEETYGVESFERNLRYSPNEIQRQHFSVRTFGDRQTLTPPSGENNRSTVKFEDDQRMHSPSRRIDDHLPDPDQILSRSPHLDTTPVRIPRARIDQNSRKLPETTSTPSPTAPFLANVPLKKVIRKARLVSIHDGRPMGPFVDTVHYEPVVPQGTTENAEWRTTPSSTRRTTNGLSPRRAQLFGHNPELWTSSSSCSLSSNEDEREEVRGRRSGRPVVVQHNPLRLYEVEGRR